MTYITDNAWYICHKFIEVNYLAVVSLALSYGVLTWWHAVKSTEHSSSRRVWDPKHHTNSSFRSYT